MKTIIVVLLLELFVNCHEIHTFVVHDLHNLGDIMSDYYDEITLKIHTTQNLQMEIICGKYTFEPGNSVSLDGLTFSIGEGEILTITLEQFNAVAANQAIKIVKQMDNLEIGYYTAKLTLDQFRNGYTIGLQFDGVGFTYSESDYTHTADYLLVLQLVQNPSHRDAPTLTAQCYSYAENIENRILLIVLLITFLGLF